MEFFIGAATTLACVIILNRFAQSAIKEIDRMPLITDTQSKRYEILKPAYQILAAITPPKEIDTQATRFFDSLYVRIAMFGDKAYWISENSVFETDIIDGNFEKENGKKVDTMTMDKVELDKIMHIVQQLTEEDKHDRGYPGKSKF
jgi:hypothetical protein